MDQRPKYKTKQRDILLDYLKASSGTHVTAGDVCEYFRSRGASIGQSTVYRRLESLVDEGIVNKYTIDSNSPACFEYTGADCHAQGKPCYHLKCEGCGRLIHLDCHEMSLIGNHLLSNHGFQLDTRRTVFYGLCDRCRSTSL